MTPTRKIAQIYGKIRKVTALMEMEVGSRLHSDRNYFITSAPDFLTGQPMILTPNDDKHFTEKT